MHLQRKNAILTKSKGQVGFKIHFLSLPCSFEMRSHKTKEGGDFVRKYEIIFIVKPLEEEAVNAVVEKFTKLITGNGGTIDKEDRWGKKRLAYEIKDESEGYYVLLNVSCESACVAECDRVMKITDELLKHMIVRTDEE